MILQQNQKILLCVGVGGSLDFTCEVIYGVGKVISGCLNVKSGEDFLVKKSEILTKVNAAVESYITQNQLSQSLSDNLRNIASNYDFYLLPKEIIENLDEDKDCIIEFSEFQNSNDYTISYSPVILNRNRTITLFAEFEAYQDNTEISLSNLSVG